MQYTLVNSEGLERQYKVVIPAKDLQAGIDTELTNLSKKAKLPGFRAGKVPMNVVKQKYQKEVRDETVKNLVRNGIDKVIKENNLDLATSPTMDDFKFDEGKDVEFTLKAEILPAIQMPNFSSVKLKTYMVQPTDKEMDKQLGMVADAYKIFKKASKTTKAKKGDQVVIDAVGSVDGKKFDGGKLVDHELVLGSKTFIDNFEEQLEGSKAGDKILVKAKFPDAYHAKDLAGKVSEFDTVVKEVRTAETPEINDELAEKCKCKNVEELKTRTLDMIMNVYDEEIYQLAKKDLFDQLDAALKFDVPKSMYEHEYNVLKQQSGEAEDDNEKISDKKLDKYLEKIAMRRLRIGMLLAEYVKKNKIALAQEDIQNAVSREASSMGGRAAEVISFYQNNPQALERMSGRLLEDKAVKHIIANEIVLKKDTVTIEKIEKIIKDDREKKII